MQTIFLFSGIENHGSNYGILQPVLQWGRSAIGGDDSWAIASFFVPRSGKGKSTKLIAVRPGDVLTGLIRRSVAQDAKLSYSCEFEGRPGTLINVNTPSELLWFNQTLEAYSLTECDNYPSDEFCRFSGIELLTSDGRLAPQWKPNVTSKACGQDVSSTSSSEVLIRFRKTRAIS